MYIPRLCGSEIPIPKPREPTPPRLAPPHPQEHQALLRVDLRQNTAAPEMGILKVRGSTTCVHSTQALPSAWSLTPAVLLLPACSMSHRMPKLYTDRLYALILNLHA